MVTRGADFNTQPANQYPIAQDITATELSGDNKLGGVLGYLQSSQRHRLLLGQRERRRQPGVHHHDSGRRSWRVHQQLWTPSCCSSTPNGDLVAIAAGNAPDGRNSVIDFTVPAGDAGTWTIAVTLTGWHLRRVRPAGHRGHRQPCRPSL